MSMRYQAGFITASYNGLKVPNAPTIGTATAGISQISIAFTAPSDVGGGAITSYLATATKTSDGTTVSTSGTSSPIVITGLEGTAYTVKVFAINTYGLSASSAASNSVTPLVIGASFGGGFFAGQISTAGNSIADYNLVVAPRSTGQTVPIQWKTDTTGGDPSSVIDGPANSSTMNSSTYPAAQFCKSLSIGGYSDWYMPAKNELEVCYYNLKPTTTSNSTIFTNGVNPNAVPARASNYTAGTPAQTSATVFQTGNTQYFSSAFYWSSTQYSNSTGSIQSFSTGNQTYNLKTNSTYRYVRAIRRVAV